MSIRALKACAWGGPAALVISSLGWLIAGVLPLPLGPADSTSEVYAFYTDHNTRLKVGLVIASLGITLMMMLVAAISVHLLRVEGRLPVLSFLQLVAGAVTAVLLLVPQLIWLAMAYRPETHSAQFMLNLNDLSWLLFITPIAPFIVQNVAIGYAVLSDATHVFPRWVGWANMLVAASFLPDVLAYFFFSGPFAWNGIFIFWLALTTYALFLCFMCHAVLQANRQLLAEGVPADAAALTAA